MCGPVGDALAALDVVEEVPPVLNEVDVVGCVVELEPVGTIAEVLSM